MHHKHLIFSKLVSIAFAVLICIIIAGCDKPSSSAVSEEKIAITQTSSASQNKYSNKLISFYLPEGWEVFEELKLNTQRQRINIITDIGSSATIDLFIKSEGSAPSPSQKQHIANYIAAILPPETEDKSQIDFGEVTRLGKSGMFVNIVPNEPNNTHLFVETFSFKSEDVTSHVIFNTQDTLKDSISKKIDVFLTTVKLD